MRSGAVLEAAVGVGVIVLLAARARVFDPWKAWVTTEAVGAVVAVVVAVVLSVVVAVGGVVGGVVGSMVAAVVPSRRSYRLVVGCGVDNV
jgi:hypothetical protein